MKKYIPEIGDLVKFKGKESIIIFVEERETIDHISYDRTYYYISEDKIPSLENIIEKEKLLEICDKIDVKNKMKLPRFLKIQDKKYEIKLISCFKIEKN